MRLNQDLIQRMFDGRGGVAGGGSSLDPGLINGLATEMWTEENYVSKTFFNELFVIHKKTTTTVYDGDTVVSTTVDTSGTFAPNEIPSQEESTDEETGYRTVVVTEVDNIEAKKGLWTDFFLSALGLNGSGGGGGIGDVTWQALGDNTDTRQIASSHLTTALGSALAGYATQSWVTSQNYVTSSAISDMATKTWVNNQSFVNWTALGDTTTTQQIALSHLTTALSGYATQTWVTNNFSTPATVATQLQTYAKIQNGTITIGDTSLTPITSVSGTFWGKSFTNGGTVNGTIKAGSNGGAIEQFHSVEMNSAGTLAGYGGFIDFHYYATGSTFDSSLDYTSRIIESEVGVISILAKNNNATNANKLAGLLVGDGYDGSYVQIGNIRIVYDSTNNALKVVKLVSGSEVAANFYATGSVSALGYGSGGGGGTGDVTWTNLADNTDTRQIALSHLTGALSGYATTSQLAGYLPLSGGDLYNSKHDAVFEVGNVYDNDITTVRCSYDHYGVFIGTKNTASQTYYLLNCVSGISDVSGFGGTSRFFVRCDGNVGIGTTNPTRTLDVEGSARCYYLAFKNYDNNSNAGYVGRGSSLNNNIQLIAYSGNALTLGANGSDILYITTSGNVGIGTTTPSYKLHVVGNIYGTSFIKDGGTSAQFLKADGSVDSNTYATTTQLGNYLPLTGGSVIGGNSAEPVFMAANVNDAVITTVRCSYGSGYGLFVATNKNDSTYYVLNCCNGINSIDGAGANSLFVVRSDGNVGIGTAPSYLLDVNGISRSNYMLFRNYNSSGNAGYVGRGGSATNNIQLIAYSGNALVLGANGSNLLYIATSGNVGIGTESPSYKFHVNGNVFGSSFIKDGGTSAQFLKADGSIDSNTYATTTSLDDYIPKNGGTLNGVLILTDNAYFRGASSMGFRFNDHNSNYNNLIIKEDGVTYIRSGLHIGTTSRHPSCVLDVNGAARCTFMYFKNYGDDGLAGYIGRALSSSNNIQLTAYSGNALGLGANNADNVLFIATSLNIGIGTTSPSYKLHVVGNVFGSSFIKDGGTSTQFLKADGSIDSNTYALASDLSNYLPLTGGDIYNTTTSDAVFEVGSVYGSNITTMRCCYGGGYGMFLATKLTDSSHYILNCCNNITSVGGSGAQSVFIVNCNGNVGVNTSSPSYSLDVNGISRSNYMLFRNYNSSGNAGYIGRGSSSNNSIQLIAYSGNALVLGANGSNLLYITTGANVGIGTSSPSTKLHVNGTATINGSVVSDTNGGAIEGFQSWELNTHNTAGTNIGGFLDFHYNGTAQDYSVRLIEKDYSGVLQILAKDTGTGNAQRAGLIVGAGTYTSFIQIGNGRIVWNDTDHALRIVDADGNACNLYATGGISALGYQSGGGGGGSTGVFSTSITPDTTGTYDIGTSSGYKWRNIYLCGSPDGSKGFSIITNYSDYTYIGSVQKVRFGCNVDFDDWIHVENRIEIGGDNSNYDLYVSGENGGDAYFLGNVSVASLTNRSDMRLKDVVGDVNLSVQQIASAPTFKFRFKEKAKRTMVGTSAQYWDAVLPESVTRDADGILGLDYGVTALVSTIILAKGMTEHERRITKLEKENAELRARIKDLEEN